MCYVPCVTTKTTTENAAKLGGLIISKFHIAVVLAGVGKQSWMDYCAIFCIDSHF